MWCFTWFSIFNTTLTCSTIQTRTRLLPTRLMTSGFRTMVPLWLPHILICSPIKTGIISCVRGGSFAKTSVNCAFFLCCGRVGESPRVKDFWKLLIVGRLAGWLCGDGRTLTKRPLFDVDRKESNVVRRWLSLFRRHSCCIRKQNSTFSDFVCFIFCTDWFFPLYFYIYETFFK